MRTRKRASQRALTLTLAVSPKRRSLFEGIGRVLDHILGDPKTHVARGLQVDRVEQTARRLGCERSRRCTTADLER